MKVNIKTYGCTLNKSDSDIMRSILANNDIPLSQSEDDSDVIIVNTCTVKTATQQKILSKLERLKDDGKKVIVTGCMANANSDLIKKYADGVSIVTTPNIDQLPNVVKGVESGKSYNIEKFKISDRMNYYKPNGGVISRIPISDGCLSNCSFCETKRARGPLNSFNESLILKAIENNTKRGSKEVELTSQDVGAYGFDKKTNIGNLLSKIKSIGGDYRVRIGMLNPEHALKYIDSFIDALNDDHFYKFLHIPVQSGSDKVLKDMNRDYNLSQFYELVDNLRSNVEDLTIETDIIVGYPTETDEDFEETLSLIKDVKPAVTNLSKFAIRPHARASKLAQLSENEIKRRSVETTRLIKEVQNSINRRFIGTSQDIVITESTNISTNGRNESYKEVVINEKNSLNLGDKAKVKIQASTANALYGKLVN